MGPLLSLVLTATPYFFTHDHALYRAEGGATARLEMPGLVMGHTQRAGEAAAVVCPKNAPRTDALPGCEVFYVDRAGTVQPLGFRGYSAEIFPGNRAVAVWTDDLRLLKYELASGAVQELARGVLEPRLFPDGTGISFSRAPGLTRLTPGFNACPYVQSFGDEAKRVAGPCHAQAPFVSPGGSALYVSTESGLATMVNAGRAVLSRSGFIPVPGRELVWLDADRALYTAHYETQTLWLFDARTRTARQVGVGREPAIVDGRVLAFDGARVVEVEVTR